MQSIDCGYGSPPPGPRLGSGWSGRRRTLELEDHFDEQLGPFIRRLVFHELLDQRARQARIAARLAPAPLRRFPRLPEGCSR